MGFRATRTVQVFGDGSELIYLIEDKSYIWQRPEDGKTRFAEVALLGDSDTDALAEVKRLAACEFMGGV